MPSSNPLTPLSQEDQAEFFRIWKRVMPHSDPSSPIVLSVPPAEEQPFSTDHATPAPPRESLSSPSPSPSDAHFSALVQEMAIREQVFAQRYRGLSRRLSGESARSARVLAAQAQKNARRLSAVYFLLTGVRFLPPSPPVSPPSAQVAGLIRRSFSDAQAAEAAFRTAAQTCPSPFLKALFLSLAENHADHQQQLLTLLTLI